MTKDELWRAVWPGVIVTDAALTMCMSEVRKALADDAKAPRYIATVHRRGYRFIAPVEDVPKPSPPAVIAGRSYRRFAWIAAGLLALAAPAVCPPGYGVPLPRPEDLPAGAAALDWHDLETHPVLGAFRWSGPNPAPRYLVNARLRAPAMLSVHVLAFARPTDGTQASSREAATMVLTDDNFATIVAAIEEGRRIYANIQKVLRYLLATNLGEVLVMFLGVALASTTYHFPWKSVTLAL